MEIHVHKLRETAIIFDQFSLIIEHWQNEERERDRAEERVRGEEAEANSRLEREMQEREINSLALPTAHYTTSLFKFLEYGVPGV